MAGEPEANFLKIILLLMKYGTKVLQKKIVYELRVQKWQTVTDFLRERKHDILHLTNNKRLRNERHAKCKKVFNTLQFVRANV